jgi:hypothetical protein
MAGFEIGVALEGPIVGPAADVRERLGGLAHALVLLGASSLYLQVGSPRPPGEIEVALDAVVALGALSVKGGLFLGMLVSTDRPPSPALLARYLSALDLCSDGRAEMVLTSELARPRALVEFHEVVRLMLSERAPSFTGETIRIAAAYNEPRGPRPIPVGVWCRSPLELAAVEASAYPPARVLAEDPALAGPASARGAQVFAVIRANSAPEVAAGLERALGAGSDGALVVLAADGALPVLSSAQLSARPGSRRLGTGKSG